MTGNLADEELTLDWYRAKAMLMGWAYDPRDHTFNVIDQHNDRFSHVIDADTMATRVGIGAFREITRRSERILAGELGPKCLHGMSTKQRGELWDEELKRINFARYGR